MTKHTSGPWKGLPKRCECGGEMIYEQGSGYVFSSCAECTPTIGVGRPREERRRDQIRSGTAWCVWIREAYDPDGVWFPLVHTIRGTRSESIKVWGRWWGEHPRRGMNWSNYRRRGLVRAARIFVEPALPRLDFPER